MLRVACCACVVSYFIIIILKPKVYESANLSKTNCCVTVSLCAIYSMSLSVVVRCAVCAVCFY